MAAIPPATASAITMRIIAPSSFAETGRFLHTRAPNGRPATYSVAGRKTGRYTSLKGQVHGEARIRDRCRRCRAGVRRPGGRGGRWSRRLRINRRPRASRRSSVRSSRNSRAAVASARPWRSFRTDARCSRRASAGDRRTRRPESTRARCSACGSVTKQFTAAAALLLAEQGKLSVNDKVASNAIRA